MSVNRGVKGGDAGGLLLSLAVTQPPPAVSAQVTGGPALPA